VKRCCIRLTEYTGRLIQLPKLSSVEVQLLEYNRMEYFQLEETYDDHLVQLPDHFRADQKLKHVIKGVVQMPLKH